MLGDAGAGSAPVPSSKESALPRDAARAAAPQTPAPTPAPRTSAPATSQGGARRGAAVVAPQTVSSLESALGKAGEALTTARAQLAAEQRAVAETGARLAVVGRSAFMADTLTPAALYTDLGISSVQARADAISAAVAAEARAADRMTRARQLVRRADLLVRTRTAQLRAERARVERARQAEASAVARRNPALTDGPLLPPLTARLSSTFGSRYDPYYNVWQLHAGIDLAAPSGTAINAAASGTVTRAGWNGGYGNFTCIDHGSGPRGRLTTCYAHQARIVVTVGQRVTAGQIIGRVGSTGASTGAHLHFEVRLSGRAVDPLGWLP